MRKCKYCGNKAMVSYKEPVCSNCYDKLPTVRKLVKLFQVIKKECGVDEK